MLRIRHEVFHPLCLMPPYTDAKKKVPPKAIRLLDTPFPVAYKSLSSTLLGFRLRFEIVFPEGRNIS
jgi:hypothetical protein